MPSLGDFSQLITAVVSALTLIYAVRNRRVVTRIEKHTNGMVATLEAAAKAKGVIQGNAESDARNKN